MSHVKKGRERNLSVGVPTQIRSIVFAIRFIAAAVLASVLLTSLCAAPVCAGQRITRIDVSDKPDVVSITISAVKPISLVESRVGNKYIVFDVKGGLSWSDQRSLTISDGGVRKISYGWFNSNPASARIAVSVDGHKTYSKSYLDGKRSLVIRIAKSGRHAVAKLRAIEHSKPILVASTNPFEAAAGAEKSSRTISLDFVGTDIHDVLKALAVQGGVNIVAGPDVKGEVTVSLSHVTVDEALRLVTGLIGCKYALQNGTYIIGSSANMQNISTGTTGEGISTEVISLKQAEPGQVQKTVSGQFSNLQVSVSNATSEGKKRDANMPCVVVLSGPVSAVNAAKAMVQGIEDTLAVGDADNLFELYEVKYAEINELAAIVSSMVPSAKIGIGPHTGFNLKCAASAGVGSTSGSSGSGSSGSMTSSSGGYDASSSGGSSTGTAGGKGQIAPPKILILEGSSSDIKKAKAILEKMDIQQPQIIIEAKVIDISTDVSKSLGIDWSWAKVQVEELSRDPTNKATSVNSPISSVHLGKFSRTPIEATATINAMVSNGTGKVLANPQIMALDGKPASIFIGDEVKYVSSVQQTPSGTNVTTDTASVGVLLNSISRISPDGYITMNLHPEVGMISSWVDTPDGGSLPQIARRYVDSTIRIKNGETIVIGGLIRDDDINKVSGIPVLKDLPFLGQLFRTKSVSKQHSEIMMFITPRIVPSN